MGGFFALLDPLLRRPTLVVEMDDGSVRPGERGDDEADPGEELSQGDARPWRSPAAAGPTTWPDTGSFEPHQRGVAGLASGPCEQVLDPPLQYLIGREPDGISHVPPWAAATFGLLAIDLFTTTGMRMNEAMQIRLTSEAFVRLVTPAPHVRDPAPRIHYAFRLIPKGERTNTPQIFFIGRETMRLLVVVATMLGEHYGLAAAAPLPTVAFNPHDGRAHRFGPAPYLFQYQQRHLSNIDITACMRFLLHGMVFRTRDDKPVVLKSISCAMPSPPMPSTSRRSPSTSSARGSSNYVVRADADLLSLREVRGIPIVDVPTFWQRLAEHGDPR
jgi:hypothetical protein